MHNIYHNSLDKGHGYDSFKRNFIEICEQHRSEGRALAFAFILYDFNNPHIYKVLSDDVYWKSLNEISGKYLTVFSIHYKERRRMRAGTNNAHAGTAMQYLTSINSFEAPEVSTNEIIGQYFGDGLKVTYPAILFFQTHGKVVNDALLISLTEPTIEKSFSEIKKYINSAVEALQAIKPEFNGNSHEIFDQLVLNIKHTKAVKVIKRSARLAKSIIELAAALAALAQMV